VGGGRGWMRWVGCKAWRRAIKQWAGCCTSGVGAWLPTLAGRAAAAAAATHARAYLEQPLELGSLLLALCEVLGAAIPGALPVITTAISHGACDNGEGVAREVSLTLLWPVRWALSAAGSSKATTPAECGPPCRFKQKLAVPTGS